MRISDGSADVCSSDLPRVREAARRAAITRGPIVYCAEWPDAPGRKALDLVVAPDAPLEPRVDAGFMGGATLIDTLRHQLAQLRSEEHTSELQSLMRISYAVFCLKKKKKPITKQHE